MYAVAVGIEVGAVGIVEFGSIAAHLVVERGTIVDDEARAVEGGSGPCSEAFGHFTRAEHQVEELAPGLWLRGTSGINLVVFPGARVGVVLAAVFAEDDGAAFQRSLHEESLTGVQDIVVVVRRVGYVLQR